MAIRTASKIKIAICAMALALGGGALTTSAEACGLGLGYGWRGAAYPVAAGYGWRRPWGWGAPAGAGDQPTRLPATAGVGADLGVGELPAGAGEPWGWRALAGAGGAPVMAGADRLSAATASAEAGAGEAPVGEEVTAGGAPVGVEAGGARASTGPGLVVASEAVSALASAAKSISKWRTEEIPSAASFNLQISIWRPQASTARAFCTLDFLNTIFSDELA